MTAPAPTTSSRRRRGWRWQPDTDDALVVAAFFVTRALYLGVAGVRMDVGILAFAPHIPDLGVLQRHLLETSFYQHTQPPLFPFLLGLVLKLSPFPDGITLQVVYLALGLTLLLLLRRVLQRLGLRRWAVLAAVGLAAIYPALVVIENLPTYDEPTIVLLLWLVLLVCDHVKHASDRGFATLVAVAAAVVLIRTVFHPLWWVLLVVGVLVLRRPAGGLRKALLIAAVPLLLILGFMVKNQVLYGQFSLTTWLGPSLSKISASVVQPRERDQLIASGDVSPIFGQPVFFDYDTYAPYLPSCTVHHRDVEVLAEPLRPRSGTANLNYWCQLQVYRQQQDDAFSFIRHHPGEFADAELAATQMYFEPASPIIYTRNVHRLERVDDVFEQVVLGRVSLDPVVRTNWSVLRVLAYGGIDLLTLALLAVIVSVGLGVVAAIRLRRGERRVSSVGWLVVGFFVAWTTLSGSLFEINENARYRLLVDPLLIGTLVFLVDRAVASLQTRAPAKHGAPATRRGRTPRAPLRRRRSYRPSSGSWSCR